LADKARGDWLIGNAVQIPQGVQQPFEFPHRGAGTGGEQPGRFRDKPKGQQTGLADHDLFAGVAIGLLDPAQDPREEAGLQFGTGAREQAGMTVGGEHKSPPRRFELLKRMQELFLHAWLAVKKVDIVDQQHIDPSQLGAERREFVAAERGGEEIGELLGGHQQGLWAAGMTPQLGDDPFEQVGLARACAPKEIEGMPGRSRVCERLGRGEGGGGVGPGDEIFEAAQPTGDCEGPRGLCPRRV
jgi:hypothetical protein